LTPVLFRQSGRDDITNNFPFAPKKSVDIVGISVGKPVAKLVPADTNTDDIYGFFRGKGEIIGDVISPALSEEDWGQLK
jgi:hypothetical protein